MTCLRAPSISTQSLPGLMVSASVASGSSCARIWSKYATCELACRGARVPASGCELAEDQLEQRGLAGAVRADEADLVAAQDARARSRRRSARVAVALDDVLAARRRACRERSPASTASSTWPSALAPRRALAGAAARAAARGPRCACAAPRRPCGSRPPPARAACRTCAFATASAASCSALRCS